MKNPLPHRRNASSTVGIPEHKASRRGSTQQRTLFDLSELGPGASQRRNRTTPLDRRFVVEALQDIYRLSSEPHIRQIADDVLFAHRIPTQEKPTS